MHCSSPITLKNDSLRPPVPCNNCPACVSRKKKELRSRILFEHDYSSTSSSFVTLTYSQENLPETNIFPTGNVSRADTTLFLKRFRKNYTHKYGYKKIRYYLTAEYGSPLNSFRPHYHLIMFDLDPVKVENILKTSWTLGHTRTDPFKSAHASYVAGYTLKKLKQTDYPKGQKPMFNSYSNGLGLPALKPLLKKIKSLGLFPSKSISMVDRYLIETSNIQQQLKLVSKEENLFHGFLIRHENSSGFNYQIPLMGFDDPRLRSLYVNTNTGKPHLGVTSLTLDRYMQKKLFELAYPELENLLSLHKKTLNLKYARQIDGVTVDVPPDSVITSSPSYMQWLKTYSMQLHRDFLDYDCSPEKIHDQKKLAKRQRLIDKKIPTH